MIVISDTTPLNYLVLIEQQELLARLFERVIIPQAVWTELQAGGTPEQIKPNNVVRIITGWDI